MKRFLKRVIIFAFVIFMLAGGCVFYAFRIEPYRITVNGYHVTEQGTDGEIIKIVQFSDVHIKEDFTFEDLDRVVEAINGQEPDIVVFTGDLYDIYAQYNEDADVIRELEKIQARYDKIAIWGNHDYGGGAVRQYADIMEQAGFTLLKNGNWYVTAESGKKILFTGLDDGMLGEAYMPEDTKIYEPARAVLLMHEPDMIEQFSDQGYDLILCGHSHGGQIDIPFLPMINQKAVSATSFATRYTRGMYDLGDSKMYVNTGIGTTHISARFGVVPEIAVFYVGM